MNSQTKIPSNTSNSLLEQYKKTYDETYNETYDETLNSAYENSIITTTSNYYYYIMYLFIAIFLIILLFRYTSTSRQIGGGIQYGNFNLPMFGILGLIIIVNAILKN
jgi:hypothetical protein